MKFAAFTKFALATALTVVTPVAVFAQQATPAVRQSISRPSISARDNQQERIGQGVQERATDRAARPATWSIRKAGINREERGMRAQDNGHLTRQDKRVINHQQNQESRRIYRDKHNSRVKR